MDTSLQIFSHKDHIFRKYQSSDLKWAITGLLKDPNAVLLLTIISFLSITVIAEFVMGVKVKGFHLMVDSLHNVLNILALAFSLASMTLARMQRNERFTYGYIRLEIISSFATCCFLAFLGMFLVFRAVHDLLESLKEEGEHNHGTGPQRFDLMTLFNGTRLFIYFFGAVFLRKYSSLIPDPNSSTFTSKLLCTIHMGDIKKDENISGRHKRASSSNYTNMHTVYLHFVVGSLLTGTFVCLHYVEFLHQSNIEILFAIGILVYTIKRIKPVMILASDVLLQALPAPYEFNIERQLIEIKKMQGIVRIDKLKYWALTPNYAVINMTLIVSNVSLKTHIEQEVRDILQEHFAEIVIEIKSLKAVKEM